MSPRAISKLATIATVLAAIAACSSTDDGTDDGTGGASECSTASSQTLACPVLPGEFPPPDCDAASTKEPGACKGGGCSIDQTKCGSSSTCLPLGDNKGRTVQDFRIRRLVIAAPDSLAAIDFQAKVTIPTMDLKTTECGERGADGWSWLLRVDRTKRLVTTGGAPPSTDPFNLGYCFFNSDSAGKKLAPAAQLPIRLDEKANTFSTGAADKLLMPLFVGGDPKNLIILPISDFALRNVKLSSDDNCIGALNPKALDGACKEDPTTCSKWRTAGAMAGYISLEDADGIDVKAFGQSLCAVLTKHKGAKCPREGGKITLKGDYCSKTRAACGCQDSFWVAATFAASAVRIHDGSSVPECGSP